MLTLPIKKKWYDMILSGKKKEEYRDVKPYYERRIKRFKNEITSTLIVVKFRNGYSRKSPAFIAICELGKGKGKPEWGAEPGKEYIIFKIKRIFAEKTQNGWEIRDGI